MAWGPAARLALIAALAACLAAVGVSGRALQQGADAFDSAAHGARRRRLLKKGSKGSSSGAPPCPPDSFNCGPTSIFDREKCGRKGQRCCEVQIEDYKFIEICDGDELYCLGFPSSTDSGGDGGSSSAPLLPSLSDGASGGDARSTNLCLPMPDGCGAAGGVCCPLPGNRSDASARCRDKNTICQAPNSDTIYGLLTDGLYRDLEADPEAAIPPDVQLSVWGTCKAFDPASCGQPGGLCGPTLPPPGPQCPRREGSGCPDGYFCKEQEGEWQVFGLCTLAPLGCGALGAPCCPPGNYSSGAFATPFCSAPDVYCAALADDVERGRCLSLPVSPRDCGAPGAPCCPTASGVVTDKPLPPLCQDGAYCNVTGPLLPNATSLGDSPGTCAPNVPGCGAIAQPCCVVNSRSGLLHICNDGFFCPDPSEGPPASGGDGADSGGVLMAAAGPGDRVCQECTPLVPARYQTTCGYGVSGGSGGSGGGGGGGNGPGMDYTGVCNPDDYYCGYDYAPAPAPGPNPYSDVAAQPAPGAAPPRQQQQDEEPPPAGAPAGAAPGPAPDLAAGDLQAPPPPIAAPAPAPAPSPPDDLTVAEERASPAPAPGAAPPGAAPPGGWPSLGWLFEELQQVVQDDGTPAPAPAPVPDGSQDGQSGS